MERISPGTRLGMFEIVGDIPIDPVRIDGDEAILGRGPDSDIVLEDPRVSRRHARVWMDEHRMLIQDLGSRSGTSVNGTTIADVTELRTGDHLRLGLTELAVVWNPGLAITLDMPVVGSDEVAPNAPTLTLPAGLPATSGEEAPDGYRTYSAVAVIRRSVGMRVDEPSSLGADRHGRHRAVVPPPDRALRSRSARDEPHATAVPSEADSSERPRRRRWRRPRGHV